MKNIVFRSSNKTRKFYIYLCGMIFLAVILFGLVAAYRISEDRIRNRRALLGLETIYLSLEHYVKKNGCLPKAVDKSGNYPVSWRIEVGSYCDQFLGNPIEYNRQKPWNDPDNLQFQLTAGYVFRYAPIGGQSDLGNTSTIPQIDKTHYLAITGLDTAFDPERSYKLEDLPADLILVVRVEKSDIHWMQPGDLDVDELLANEKNRQLLVGDNGYAVLFADGECWWLSDQMPHATLCKFLTRTYACRYDRERILGPFKLSW